jgi:hypothetical protein
MAVASMNLAVYVSPVALKISEMVTTSPEIMEIMENGENGYFKRKWGIPQFIACY